jgi:hypothetical protein
MDAVVPKSWKAAFLDDEMEPSDNSFGFGTSMRVGSTCGGECKSHTADEYAKSANKSFFDNMLAHTPPPKIIKDEKTDGRRVMIAEDTNTDGNVNKTSVMIAVWKDGADQYYYCTADLAPESKDLAPAFEKACLASIAP